MLELKTTSLFRALAIYSIFILVAGPLAPAIAYADATTTSATSSSSGGRTLEDRLAEINSDTTPPVISAHSGISATTTSASGAVITYTAPSYSDDVDGTGTATCAPPSGSTFPVGTTAVTCNAADSAGNSATPTTFSVMITLVQDSTASSTTDTATSTPDTGDTSTSTPQTATSTPSTATSSPQTATSSPSTATSSPQTATSTPSTGDSGGGSSATTTPQEATSTPSTVVDPDTDSTATSTSAVVPPDESNTDNTDFENITDGPGAPGPNDPRPVVDASATTTQNAVNDPLFAVASSTDGTGSKTGGTIFTGSAAASTTAKNVLNITNSSVDGPGETNSSIIKSSTDNTADLTTDASSTALSGENRALGGEGDATIHTGIARSSASVINVVNTNLFNSNGLVLFLDPQNGDGLDLRDFDLSYFNGGPGASPTQYGCTILTCLNSSALSVLNKNQATVRSDVHVRAQSGGNAATSTVRGSVDIATGDAYASANVLNLVNTNFINSSYLITSFNNFGDMQGDIVLPSASFFDQLLANGNALPDLNSSSYIVNNDNNQNFTGTTTARAITGQNVASTTPPGRGHGSIVTGKAHTSSNSFTAANQTRVGGASVLIEFHISGEWSGTVKGLPAGLSWRRTDYGVEIYSNGSGVLPGSAVGEYNSSTFIASSTNRATVETNVEVLAQTGGNYALTEDGIGSIATGDAYASANVVNLVNTNIVGRKWVFANFNIFGDWGGDIDFGGHSPDLGVATQVDTPTPTISGATVTYHFTVTNTGDVAASNVALSAAYDTNLLLFTRANAVSQSTPSGTSWEIGSLAAGETKVIDADARITAPNIPAGYSMILPLTASVSSSARDQDSSDNTQKVYITVQSSATNASTTPSADTDPRDRGTSGGSGGGSSGGGGSSSGGSSGGGSTSSSGGGGTSSGGGTSGGGGGTTSGGASSGNGAPLSQGAGNGAPASSGAGNSAAAAGGGGGGGAGTFGTSAATSWVATPKLTVSKTVSVATSTLPAYVDYTVIVKNAKSGGPLYKGKLTDTLHDPSDSLLYERSWDIGTLDPGDGVKLTYTVLFSATSTPGSYANVATVTGFQDNVYLSIPINPVSATGTVELRTTGLVLGVSTSSSPEFSDDEDCLPLLSKNLRQGMSGSEVTKLQTFLAQDSSIYPQGLITGYFGPLTTAAAKRFQERYADEILKPVGLTYATGLVYASTIRQINILACGGVSPDVPDTPITPAVPSTPTTPSAPAKATTKKTQKSASGDDATSGFFDAFTSLFSGFW